MFKVLLLCGGLALATSAAAKEYPDMLGTWTGEFRTVSSGTQVSGEIAKDGALIAQSRISLVINHQDGEVFIGDSVNRQTNAATPVWGAIRSTGTEGIFVTQTGGRGSFWFESPTQFEFCFGSSSEAVLSAYCGVLTKE